MNFTPTVPMPFSIGGWSDHAEEVAMLPTAQRLLSEETPRELYSRLEARLSPLLRETLARELPQIDPSDWWQSMVLPSLSPIQADHVREEGSLAQFDYPALVNIFYRNWRVLRSRLQIGDEITNYLFTVKTFRNDVEHRPDLVLDDARRRLIEQSASLAVSLLSGHSASPERSARGHRRRRLAVLLGAVVVGLAGLNTWYANARQDTVAVQSVHREAELSKLGSWLEKPTLQTCLRYQKKTDASWSKAYTVRGRLEHGALLREKTGHDRFDPDRHYLIVHWKKTAAYTIIPLADGHASLPSEATELRDFDNRNWLVKAGWNDCRSQ